MSDGNFNRALLPHTPYQSGMKMGKAMARNAAIEAFKEYLRMQHTSLDEEEIRLAAASFAVLLARHCH